MRRSVGQARVGGAVNDDRGLSAAEVGERRARYGANAIVEATGSGWAALLRDTLRDPMIGFLAATAALLAGVGERVEAIVLALALLPIAAMDAYLHRRTQASTASLAGRLAPNARVVRDGTAHDIAAIDLVPGDLVVVASGATFPADGLIVAGADLQVDESTLTGESVPARKAPLGAPLVGTDELAVDGRHWGMAGTRLLTGEARVRVAFTGAETLYGEIVRSAQAGRHERTPLQQAIGSLVNALIVAAAVLCVALAATRLYQGHGVVDALVSAVTLAVAALPEEFPVVFAFFLGVGVHRLARRQALVRRAVVVENIGRVTCICTDKTGTLTEGRLHLAHLETLPGIGQDDLLRTAAIASRPGRVDPLDDAILAAAAAAPAGVLARFPFTEDRRREVALIHDGAAGVLCVAKGAPETILGMSRLTPGELAAWQARTEAFAATGHKVIACGRRALPADGWTGGEPDRDYLFLGLLAFEDPLRDGVAEAVASARAAGIRTVMVTGDHPATARAIATEIGLGLGTDGPRVVEGAALGRLLEQDSGAGLRDVDVIARAAPAQKLDLVRALQRAGEVVAVTGDGVNDVPALQGADIGIAMGERGTRTARDVAAIVLLDDNFRTIIRAIAEGRQLFGNLKLSFAYLLMTHIPLVLTAALIPLAGFPLLYLPVHIVWFELIIHPTAMLAFQRLPPEGDLRIQGAGPAGRFFARREWVAIGLVGSAVSLVVTLAYGYSLSIGDDVTHARAMAVVALAVAGATVTAALSGLSTAAARWIAGTGFASAVVLVQVPGIARLLELSPLQFEEWLIAAGSGLAAGSLSVMMPGRERRGSRP